MYSAGVSTTAMRAALRKASSTPGRTRARAPRAGRRRNRAAPSPREGFERRVLTSSINNGLDPRQRKLGTFPAQQAAEPQLRMFCASGIIPTYSATNSGKPKAGGGNDKGNQLVLQPHLGGMTCWHGQCTPFEEPKELLIGQNRLNDVRNRGR